MITINSIIKSVHNRYQSWLCEHNDFRTKRHIVVFESDDWGSIRMSNKKDWEELLKLGYAVDERPYERCDTLESSEDLEALFEVLSKYNDYKGNHPVITANMLMTNPDFEKIEKSGYHKYSYEPIADTYSRYNGDVKVLDLMRQGYEAGVFMPQSHGREHFNVARWMHGLQSGNEDLLTAFKFGMCGIAPKEHPDQGNKMMGALRAKNEEEQKQINVIVKEGLWLFEQLWGFSSKSFVAPCYAWNEEIEKILAENGVKLIQTSRAKKETLRSPRQYYYSGQRNRFNQIYSIRNCTFEPATNKMETSVEVLMKQIDDTFNRHKVAVFSTHRINYVGGLSKQNRIKTLASFDEFLQRLLEEYPDVEFLSSDKLLEVL